MKIKFDGAIVVEGKSDVQFLESFIDSEFIITNGSEVSRETIEYISSLSKIKKVIVLTDPDSPGKRIRDVLDNNIKGLYHAFLQKDQCIKKHKVGVAESNKQHVLESLESLLSNEDTQIGTLTMPDLYALGLTGQEASKDKRIKIMQKLHIGYGNAKTLLKRLNSLAISYEELEKMIEDI